MTSIGLPHFVVHIDNISGNWRSESEKIAESGVTRPFGYDIPSIFNKVQAMTGFGAECRRLLKNDPQLSWQILLDRVSTAQFSSSTDDSLTYLLKILDEVAKKAKKIGDSQRIYFQLAFRQLLNKDADSYLNLSDCWLKGHEQYESLYGA